MLRPTLQPGQRRRSGLRAVVRQLFALPGLRAGVAAAAMMALGACGVSGSSDGDAQLDGAVSVQPRVAIDGLIELSARSGGRLFVDEVVFHAPTVQIRNGPFAIADVLASDPDDAGSLFFRYALADGHTAGAIAGERRWDLSPPGAAPDSEVAFGFSPFEAGSAELDELLAHTGWDLSALSGYTAFVHGYVSIADDDDGQRTATGMRDTSSKRGGDSEGDPARTGGGEEMAGDAEGDPAQGNGEEMGGDAEGDPAQGNDEEMGGDAEGDPAQTSGEEMGGDAEGDPAQGSGEKAASFGRDTLLGRPGQLGGELVPFFLVFDSSLELGVPLAQLGALGVDDDEFLPIDLRVDVNRLLPDERLLALDSEAEAARDLAQEAPGHSGTAVLELDSTEARRAFEIDADTVQKRDTTEERPAHRIELSSDPRGDDDGQQR